MLEMRLIHHFSVMSAMPLVPDSPTRYAWSVSLPQMAFYSGVENPLMNIFLANSALHLRLLNPSDQQAVFASVYYFCLGLKTCKEMLNRVSEENSCMLFASAGAIAMQQLLSRQELPLETLYTLPTSWFRAMRGLRAIVSATEIWLRQSNLKALLLACRLPDPWIPMDQVDHFTYLLEDLENEGLSQSHLETYQGAVLYLDWAYKLHQQWHDRPTVRGHIVSFPGRLSEEFSLLLEMYEPRALVITAHFFALFKFVDEVWYMQGVARREILGILSLVPENWMWAMKWPMQQIEYPLERI